MLIIKRSGTNVQLDTDKIILYFRFNPILERPKSFTRPRLKGNTTSLP